VPTASVIAITTVPPISRPQRGPRHEPGEHALDGVGELDERDRRPRERDRGDGDLGEQPDVEVDGADDRVGRCGTPRACTTRSPTNDAVSAGTIASWRIRPRECTSRPNTAPATGTPNTAPNPPAIAAISSTRRSGAATPIRTAGTHRRTGSPTSAAPCPPGPADPPNRFVATVAANTSGAMRRGSHAVGSWISSMTRLLPRSACRPGASRRGRRRSPPPGAATAPTGVAPGRRRPVERHQERGRRQPGEHAHDGPEHDPTSHTGERTRLLGRYDSHTHGDVTLVSGQLTKAAEAVRLSRATFRTIKQNLFWAWFYNAVAIPIAAVGLLHPMIGVIAMTASSLSVVGNSLRLRRTDLTT
jgi:hypothetical protein